MSESFFMFQLDHEINFDPSADFTAFARTAPAKWVVYLMSDTDDRPVQLLCVKNLRESLKRRLEREDEVESGPTRRVNYREIVRKIRWRRVDSAFEADVVYQEAARDYFPERYQQIAGLRPAWFVHVDPDAAFPNYLKTTDLDDRVGQYFGPIEDKNTAARLIEDISDWFDLCRYYHILTEAPHGKACAYKEMGKCPAPCDGTIAMEQYRSLVEWSTRAIVDPQELIREQTARMQSAAKNLHFESAAKIKTYIDSLSKLDNDSLRYLRRLRDFKFIAIQKGPRAGCAKVFLIRPGMIEEIAGIPFEPSQAGDLLRLALELAGDQSIDAVDSVGAERIGVVTHHLFQSKSSANAFIALDSSGEASIVKAYRELSQQKPADETGEEGVVKELAADSR